MSSGARCHEWVCHQKAEDEVDDFVSPSLNSQLFRKELFMEFVQNYRSLHLLSNFIKFFSYILDEFASDSYKKGEPYGIDHWPHDTVSTFCCNSSYFGHLPKYSADESVLYYFSYEQKTYFLRTKVNKLKQDFQRE